MIAGKYRYYALIAVIGLIVAAATIWWITRGEPEQKPIPQEPEKEWYVIFYAQNQKATAYTNYSGYNVLSSSGKPYFFGGVAVHPRYPVNAGGDPLKPIIPYNTVLYLTEPLLINGESFSTLHVIDTGDVNYRLYSGSPYWIDVYHGSGDYWSIINSKEFGIKDVDYYWVEKWK